MSFPQRSRSHVLETQSEALLRTALPRKWICRKLDERDYGVDFYIEMVGQKGFLTGHIAAVQLKAEERVERRGRKGRGFTDWFYSRRVPKKTVSYWMSLQVPVFLCVAELSDRKVFFAPVKRSVRKHYGKFLRNKTFPFQLLNFRELTNQQGRYQFIQDYYRERGYDRFIQRIRDLVVHRQRYLQLFRLVTTSPSESASPKDWVTVVHLIQTCSIILKHIGNSGEQKRLDEDLKSLPKVSMRSKSRRNREVFASTLRTLYPTFCRCFQAARNHVTKSESEYWQANDPTFHKICSSLVKQNLPRVKLRSLKSETESLA